MLRFSIYFSILLSLSACSLFPDNDFAYLEDKETEQIHIPKSLEIPRKNPEYLLLNPQQVGEIGTQLDRQAPTQILAVADGSYVDDESEKNAKIWFDKTEVVDDLEAFIWESLLEYIDQESIKVDVIDKKEKQVVTNWVATRQIETGFWFWKSLETAQQTKLKYSLEMKPHGRTGVLSVELVDFEQLLNAENVKEPLVEKQRAQINALNQFIAHFDYKQRFIAQQRSKDVKPEISEQSTVSLGFDAEGWAALVSSEDLESVWSQTRTLLENLSFKVTDLDRSKRLYYVTYIPPEPGFWGKLWGGSDTPELPLSAQEYIIKITTVEEGTAISFFTKELQTIGPELITRLQKPVNQVVAEQSLEL